MKKFKSIKKSLNNFFNSIDTITTKLLILVLCSITIPLFVVANFSSDVIQESIVDNSQERLSINKKIFEKKYSNELNNLGNDVLKVINKYNKEKISNNKKFINDLFSQREDISFVLMVDSNKKIKAFKGNTDTGLIINKLSKLISIDLREEPIMITENINGDLFHLVIAPVFNSDQNSFSAVVVGKSLKNNNIVSYVNDITNATVVIYNHTDKKAAIITVSENIPGLSKIIAVSDKNNLHGFFFDGNNLLNENDFYLTIPLTNYFNQTIGKVYIGISKYSFIDWVNKNSRLISFIAIISLVVAIIFAALFARKITNPILALAEAAESINLGDLNYKVDLKGNDETVKLSRSFNRMVANLERDERLRDNFVATLTHDLKVPMLAENQTIKFLLKETYGPITSEQKEVLELMKSTNVSSLEMLGTLLEIYRYDSGNVSLFETEFDMAELANEAIKEINSLAEDKKIQINIQMNKKDIYVKADQKDIKRVMHNMVSNAINYGIRRGVINCNLEVIENSITYRPRFDTERYTTLQKPIKISKSVIVSIEDNGIGIAREDIPILFKRFSLSKGRKPSGSGLGLYYAYQVIQLHKGHMWAESSEMGGSIFKFTLPLNKK